MENTRAEKEIKDYLELFEGNVEDGYIDQAVANLADICLYLIRGTAFPKEFSVAKFDMLCNNLVDMCSFQMGR